MSYVTYDKVKLARKANLYAFLLHSHDNDVKKEGNSLRLNRDNSVSIKKDYSGFTDFANNNTGNAIDCLVNYFGYEFQDAVTALCDFMGAKAGQPLEPQKKTTMATQARPQKPTVANYTFKPPEPLEGRCKQLYAYLTKTRGIPPALVHQLMGDKILYQAKEHGNMVFIDPAISIAELRGTNTSTSFHGIDFDRENPATFWWYKPRGLETNPTVAYICEAAIDAISLYLLLTSKPELEPNKGLYCSICGVANQQRIDAIKAGMTTAGCRVVIAVDNDKAGEDCRQRNHDCLSIVPVKKDWNEDLIAWEQSTPGLIERLNEIVKNNRKEG